MDGRQTANDDFRQSYLYFWSEIEFFSFYYNEFLIAITHYQ